LVSTTRCLTLADVLEINDQIRREDEKNKS
jgi:hypothetical protein